VLVGNQLTGCRPRRRYAKPVDRVIQARFQELDQVLTRDTLATDRFVKSLAELAFEQAIGIFRLLLFLQLKRILTGSLTLLGATMLTGRVAVLG